MTRAPARPVQGVEITVGSADFSESQLLAEIYGQAIAAKGIEVKKKPNIGNREIYMAAIKDGSVDLVPEYTGASLAYFDKNSTETDPDKAYEALKGRSRRARGAGQVAGRRRGRHRGDQGDRGQVQPEVARRPEGCRQGHGRGWCSEFKTRSPA